MSTSLGCQTLGERRDVFVVVTLWGSTCSVDMSSCFTQCSAYMYASSQPKVKLILTILATPSPFFHYDTRDGVYSMGMHAYIHIPLRYFSLEFP